MHYIQELGWRTTDVLSLVDGMKADVVSGVAIALPGGRLAHPEGHHEEENEEVRKLDPNLREKIMKVELLATRDCETGYGPGRGYGCDCRCR